MLHVVHVEKKSWNRIMGSSNIDDVDNILIITEEEEPYLEWYFIDQDLKGPEETGPEDDEETEEQQQDEVEMVEIMEPCNIDNVVEAFQTVLNWVETVEEVYEFDRILL